MLNDTGNNFCYVDHTSGNDEQIFQLLLFLLVVLLLKLEHQALAQVVIVGGQVTDLDEVLKGRSKHFDRELVALGDVQIRGTFDNCKKKWLKDVPKISTTHKLSTFDVLFQILCQNISQICRSSFWQFKILNSFSLKIGN